MCSNPVRGISLLIFFKVFFSKSCVLKCVYDILPDTVAHSSFFKILTKIKFTMKSYTAKPREGVTEKQFSISQKDENMLQGGENVMRFIDQSYLYFKVICFI